MLKKVISWILVIAIVLTQVSIIAFAEDNNSEFTIVKTYEDVTNEEDGYRTWKHTIEVTGDTQPKSPAVDVVLVIDRSHSMNDTMGENGESRLDYAEDAAYAITDSILEANSESRVAVITFADGFEDSAEEYDTDLISSRSGTNYSDAYVPGDDNIIENDGDINFNFTSNKEDVVYAIETTLSSTEFWTFTTDGFDRAYNMINSRGEENDNEAYVVFLSDGAPSQALYLDEYYESTNSYGIELTDKDVVSVNEIDPTNSNHKTTDYDIDGDGELDIVAGGLNLVKAITIASAKRLQEEATVIAVSTDVSTYLEAFFEMLASDDPEMQTYYNASSEDLDYVFKTIIKDISANAQVIDNIPEYMSVIANPNSDSDEKFIDYNGNVIFTEATSEGDNEVIEWNIFDITGSETLTYYTRLNNEFDYDTHVDSNGIMDLNGETTLWYTKCDELVSAEVPTGYYFLVTYEVPYADENSTLIEDDYLYAMDQDVTVSNLIPERDGYSFAGWESDQYGLQLSGYEFNITGPTNFVAQWVEKPEYSISIEESASIAGSEIYETEILQISESSLVDFKIEVRNDGKNDIDVSIEELGLENIADEYEISDEKSIEPGNTVSWVIEDIDFSDYEENLYQHSSEASASIGDNLINVSDSVIIIIEEENFMEAEIIKEVYDEANDTWLNDNITIDEGEELIFRYTAINQGNISLDNLNIVDDGIGFSGESFNLEVDTVPEVIEIEYTTAQASKIVNYIKTVETEVDGKLVYTTEAATKLVSYIVELTTAAEITIEKNIVSYKEEEQLYSKIYNEAGIYASESNLYLEGDNFRISNEIEVIVNEVEAEIPIDDDDDDDDDDDNDDDNDDDDNEDDDNDDDDDDDNDDDDDDDDNDDDDDDDNIISDDNDKANSDESSDDAETIIEDETSTELDEESNTGIPDDMIDAFDGDLPQGPSTGMKTNTALYLSGIIALAGSSILYLKKVFSNY